MDIPLSEFLTHNPAILATVIIAAIFVGAGLAFEVGWRLYLRKKSDTYSNDDNNNEGGRNMGFSGVGENRANNNKIELDAVKSELRFMKASMAQMNEVLRSIHENTRK